MQTHDTLAEIQGIYGPVTVAERVLQKLWWSGEFQQGALQTLSGKKLERLHPGRWNKQEGPDFIDARLRLDGQEMRGDVEAHFYAKDWFAHGHHTAPTFDNVVLHLLLFPPQEIHPLVTLSGRQPEILVLLPYLPEDIEDYANREALLSLETRTCSAWLDALLEIPLEKRLDFLRAKARLRWEQKLRFARQRLARHGWEESCHQLALETLGLRRNRAPMSALAQRHPLADMPRLSPEEIFAEEKPRWKLAGLRPANHPLRRLVQYQKILSQENWPEALRRWGVQLGETILPEFPRTRHFASAVQSLSSAVLQEAVGGTRLHTLAIDAFLPLLAVSEGTEENFSRHWQHWPLGDIPARLAQDLRALLPAKENKKARIDNGLFQGLLQLGQENLA